MLKKNNKRYEIISALSNSKKVLNLFMNKLFSIFTEPTAPAIEKIKPKPIISKIVEINIKQKSNDKDFF